MGLVDYSDSSDEEEQQPRSKKRKLSHSNGGLPPLPSAFRDLYSSTVRTSTQDDPSLHGGRKRVTPHVVGNWPTHVYLEWNPMSQDISVLREVVESAKTVGEHETIHSLLQNDLAVTLPLHVSLSRPLALAKAQKESFLSDIVSKINASRVCVFKVQPLDVIWHPNEDGSRWFLVLRLRRPPGDELRKLLGSCNDVANDFKQPLLYHKSAVRSEDPQASGDEANDSFHVSLAWSLKPPSPGLKGPSKLNVLASQRTAELQKLQIEFSEVKLRIGQDVSSCSLAAPRVAKKNP